MAEDVTTNAQNSAHAAVAKKGSKGLIKLVLIPVIIGIQAVAAYYVVFNLLLEDPNKDKTPRQSSTAQPGAFYEIKDLVVNPAGTVGRRFLVMELGLEAKDIKTIDEAQSKEIWMRDAVISLLTKKTADDLLDITQREQLKKEILGEINHRLTKTKFHRIYFTKYIMQ